MNRERWNWAGGWAFFMFIAFWGLVLLTVGSSELHVVNARGYHQGDFSHQKWGYVAVSVVLSLLAGALGWKARGWLPSKKNESESNEDPDDKSN